MSNSIAIDDKKQQRDSLSISLLLHFFLILLLLFPIVNAMSKEPEQPQFEGIQVALGYKVATERTKTKPAPSTSKSKVQPTESAAAKAPAKLPVRKKTQTSTQKATKKIVSKTLEKEAAIVATKEKIIEKKETVKAEKSPVELAKEKAAEASRQKEADAKARALAEAEAKRKSEAEAKRKAAEEAAKQAAAKSAAKSKFNNLLKSANGNGAPSAGDPSGHPDATALEGMTKGKGKAGKGLGNRGLVYAPNITDSSQQTGRVVVNICVNSQGKVISADYTQKGSTTTDSHLITLAVRNAKKYKFSESSTAEQCGDITIDFKLK